MAMVRAKKALMSRTSTARMAFQSRQALDLVVHREHRVLAEIVVPVAEVAAVVADVVRARGVVVPETLAEAHLRVAAIAKLHPVSVFERVALRRGLFFFQEMQPA